MQLTEERKNEIEHIENVVCCILGVDAQDIINRNKARFPTIARNLILYILHVDYGYSGNVISKAYKITLRGVFRQIADVRYKIQRYKIYTELYEQIKLSLTSQNSKG